MPTTALDIGSHSIKTIVGKAGNSPEIERASITHNQSELAYPQDESQAEKLLNVLDKVFHDQKLPKTDVRLSLPEEIISTKIINLPPLTDSELASAIDWQAEQHIPIPLKQLSLEYQVLYRPAKKAKDEAMKVLLVGTRKDTVQLYTDVFYNLGIQPTIMETQVFSVMRALGFDQQDPTTMVINMGGSNTQIIVVDQTELKLATNKKGGGILLTKAVQQAINNITLDQAEEYKTNYGLDNSQLQGKIQAAILPALNSIGQEIVRTISYYNNSQPNSPITRLVLAGGSSRMPGLIEYFTQLTGLEVLMASPFAPANGAIPQDNQQAYIVCMGLLMRKHQ